MSNPTYANQGAVSTIADDALVMVVGSDGRYKPVSFANIAKAARETLNQGSLNLATNTSAEPTIVAGKSIFFPLTEALSAGEQVTFSFEIDYGSTRPYFEAYLGPTTGGGVSARNSINRLEVNNGFNSFTMVLTKDAATVGFYTQTGVTIKVSKVMVTRGNIPCAWTPLTEN